ISGGNVNYSDPFDGSTLPSTDGTELNSIGWGLYDTVFTKSFGDNSTPEDLFMQAYTQEMSQNYSDAITHYKEVVSSYKTSSYAPVSLSRIFNCLEKSHASSSDYQSMQNYYNSIKSNSAYPNESRELSEDFVTKSKVKQGNIQEAANDYNAIYQSNQNNSKGLHALLNKYCLENMVQGDNSSGSTNYQNHKIDILSLITGENIRSSSFVNNNTPKQFRLLQNYPNPFNPVTTIKFEIPKDVNVSIKIYDILGREVFNFNEFKLAGSYEVQFDGSNFASGMYFYKLETGGFTDTKKMVLLK
ncbi:MAG TPA: T9SS type A sorting domain-containing protein, partial [Ignavibacteria bacterium]|nr:T9SS type A sorting domain-containing protein [Ignavibacteria bacterium]